MMVKYEFEIPPDIIDEVVKLFSPRELAEYLHSHYEKYSLDLQWEFETLMLDSLYEGFDSYEEFEQAQQSLFPEAG